MTQAPLLAVKNLTVKFGSFTAVDDLSFTLNSGETLAIVGESGSGKTVTALSIMKLIELGTRAKITGGEIVLNPPGGEPVDLVALPEDELRELRGRVVSMIFQEPLTALNPVYTVGNQIAEAVRAHQDVSPDEAMATALEMLRRVRIPEPDKRIKQYPHEMSGGMRQRVMIAQALVLNPHLLICDEPTTALDVTIQAQILGLIKDLQQDSGSAVIMITHDMGVVAEIADRVVVMRRSKVVEQGTVFEVFNEPKHDYTRSLLAAVPRLGSMRGTDAPKKFDLVSAASTNQDGGAK